MFGLGIGEISLILFILLLLFGGKKLPELGSALGASLQNFKKGLENKDNKENKDKKEDQ